MAVGAFLAGCQQASSPGAGTSKEVAPAAATTPAFEPSAPPKVVPAIVVPPGVTLPSLDFPAGVALYVCDANGTRSTIDYEPRVEQLCRRHPEMGPCQYERNLCRAKGGRIYTQKGEEVTMAIEAEYDRVVRRVRFQADGGSTPPAKAPAKAPAAKAGTKDKP